MQTDAREETDALVETTPRKPDLRVFKTRETDDWSDEIRRDVGELFGIYIFDAGRRVYCCELTPSFEMWPQGTTWTAGAATSSESCREDLYDDIRSADPDADVRYYHCREVDVDSYDRLNLTDERWTELLDAAGGDEDAAYVKAIDEFREHVRDKYVG